LISGKKSRNFFRNLVGGPSVPGGSQISEIVTADR